jgi:hypothetical protein
MKLIGEIAKELFAMFLADARLTANAIVLVALVGGLLVWLEIDSVFGGALLLIGSLVIVAEAAVREARRRRPS